MDTTTKITLEIAMTRTSPRAPGTSAFGTAEVAVIEGTMIVNRAIGIMITGRRPSRILEVEDTAAAVTPRAAYPKVPRTRRPATGRYSPRKRSEERRVGEEGRSRW